MLCMELPLDVYFMTRHHLVFRFLQSLLAITLHPVAVLGASGYAGAYASPLVQYLCFNSQDGYADVTTRTVSLEIVI